MAVKKKLTIEGLEKEEQELQAKEAMKGKSAKSLPAQMRDKYEQLEEELSKAHGGRTVQFVCTDTMSTNVYTQAELETLKVKQAENKIPYHFQVYKGCYFLVENYDEGIAGYDPGEAVLRANTPVMKGGRLIYQQVGNVGDQEL